MESSLIYEYMNKTSWKYSQNSEESWPQWKVATHHSSLETWARFHFIPEHFGWRRNWVPMKKDPTKWYELYIVVILSVFAQEKLTAISSGNWILETKECSGIPKILDTECELMLIPGNPKHYNGPSVRSVWGLELVMNGVLAQVHLTAPT